MVVASPKHSPSVQKFYQSRLFFRPWIVNPGPSIRPPSPKVTSTMAVLDYVNGTLESARRQADRVVTPDSRQQAYDAIWSFAQEHPVLFVSPFGPHHPSPWVLSPLILFPPTPTQSFLVVQGLFSSLPLLLFGTFALGTIAVAALSALLFSLFWIGVAALVLGGTLFATSAFALLAWAWVVGAYLAARLVQRLVFPSADPGAVVVVGATTEKRGARVVVKSEPGLGVNGTVAGGDEEESERDEIDVKEVA